jgi:hypothetical protein
LRDRLVRRSSSSNMAFPRRMFVMLLSAVRALRLRRSRQGYSRVGGARKP